MRLSNTASFYLLASIIVAFLAGSSAPTPLYPVYQAAWHFSPVTVTVIFGIYALAVLASLLVAGSLSDFVGRRPVLIVAAILQVVTMVLFATAQGVSALVAARVVQGLSTGAAAGAVGAGMLDLDRPRGTIANAVAPVVGTATGALLSGLVARYLPAPTHLVYALLGAVFVAQGVGLAFMRETVAVRPGALASLRPHLHLPPAARAPVLLAAPALVAAWALAGFYGSLGPALVRRLAGSASPTLPGMALFVLAASGAVAVLLTRTREARAVMAAGTGGLVAGVGVVLLATATRSLPLFFLGTAIAGMGFGGAFQGAVRSVLAVAQASERAGVLSVVYVIAYLSMGVPAVLGGLRASLGAGIFETAREYGAAVMVLATLGLAGSALRRLRPLGVRRIASGAWAAP